MANEGYREPISELTEKTKDMHRALPLLLKNWRRSIGTTSA